VHCGKGHSATTVHSPDLIMFTLFIFGATAPSGPGPPHWRGF